MLCLDAEDTAGGHDGMIDLDNTAVRAGQHEIVQHVLAAGRQCPPDSVLAKARNEVVCKLGGCLAEDERQEKSAADREHEYRRPHARYPRGNGRLRRNRGQRD